MLQYKECLGRAQHIASMLCGQLTAEVEALTSSINHEEPRRQQGQRRDGGGKAQRCKRGCGCRATELLLLVARAGSCS